MMNTVGVIGLGLIGGSMAKSIKSHTEYTILGYDQNKEVIAKGISQGVLSSELSFDNAINCDMLIVALYPQDVVRVIKEYAPYLKKGTIVVDCTGIKSFVCNSLSKELNENGIYFIGGHPMAGKEVSGYDNSDDIMFSNASMILCRDEYTSEDAFANAKEFFNQIGFPRIKESTPSEHDAVIAYTSQMAHVVSNAYIKSETLNNRYGFSAGSFKDLTRVAKLNEYMWTDLFLDNKEYLLKEIDTFMKNMEQYRTALDNEDKEKLIELLGRGRELKEKDEDKEMQLLKQ